MLQLNLQQWRSLQIYGLSPHNESYRVIPYHESSSSQLGFFPLGFKVSIFFVEMMHQGYKNTYF